MELNFGEFLQNERKKKGFSQAELSKMTGFTNRAIRYWEAGEREISLKNAEIVAKALGTRITIGKE